MYKFLIGIGVFFVAVVTLMFYFVGEPVPVPEAGEVANEPAPARQGTSESAPVGEDINDQDGQNAIQPDEVTDTAQEPLVRVESTTPPPTETDYEPITPPAGSEETDPELIPDLSEN